MEKFTVKEDGALLDFLFQALKGWPKKKIKQYLTHGSILVNQQVRTQFDHPLKAGDKVEASSEKKPYFQKILKRSSIQPVYEDEDLLVIDKPPGLLTIANAGTRTETLYYKLTDYVRIASDDEEARVFIVHRLDQDVSGLIVFAKNEETKYALQDDWDKVEKKYYAVVEGRPRKEAGEIKSYLAEDASHRVYSVPSGAHAKFAVTHYRTLKTATAGDYSLLEIDLVTGRKNQIRVHLFDIGCPIAGDKKYGAQTNPVKRLCLHAYFLSFIHPATKKRLTFQLQLPRVFQQLV